MQVANPRILTNVPYFAAVSVSCHACNYTISNFLHDEHDSSLLLMRCSACARKWARKNTSNGTLFLSLFYGIGLDGMGAVVILSWIQPLGSAARRIARIIPMHASTKSYLSI